MSLILSIDPGTDVSAYVLSADYLVMSCGIATNEEVAEGLKNCNITKGAEAQLLIEKPVCRKWAGRHVSDTAIWSGAFSAYWPWKPIWYTRQKVVMNTVGKKGNDNKIVKYLKGRFAHNDAFDTTWKMFKHGKKLDIWQAYAMTVVHLDLIGGIDGRTFWKEDSP